MIIKRGTKWNFFYPYPAPPPENPRWSKDGNGKSSLAPSDQCHSHAMGLEIGKLFGIYLETLYIEFRALFQLYKCINPCISMWGNLEIQTLQLSLEKKDIYIRFLGYPRSSSIIVQGYDFSSTFFCTL